MSNASTIPAALAIAIAFAPAVVAGTGDTAVKLSPRDAGVRYGQALGAIEVCYGSKLTSKAEAMPKAYENTELEEFKAVAAETYQTWVKAQNCVNQRDPNFCKIVMDKSCTSAAAEIGQGGSVIDGLVDFAKY